MEAGNDAIVCPQCGAVNPADGTVCLECGFDLEPPPGEDSAHEPAPREREVSPVDLDSIAEQMARWERDRRERMLLGLTVYQVVLVTLIAVFVLLFTSRFLRDWPFPGSFQLDSARMVDALLKVAATVKMETTKSEFEGVLAEMMAESIRYEGKYSTGGYRTSEVYSNLHSAAELYALANEAWDNQLVATYGYRVATAPSSSAGAEVRKLWNSAEGNVKRALEKL